MNIKIFIAEDSQEDLNFSVKIINTWAKKNNISINIKATNKLTYDLPRECLDSDIALLDIEIPEISGIEFAKVLRKKNLNIFICFITTHSQFAINGYEVFAVDYLIKPVSKERLFQTLDRLVANLYKNNEFIIKIKANNGYFSIDLKSLLYIEANGHSCFFHMINEILTLNLAISKVELLLKNYDFIKTHRSYFVNLNYICSYEIPYLILSNGETVPVSINNKSNIKNALLKLYNED